MSLEQFVGKRLGNYQIAEMIGKGGMAAVYRATQPSVNREVAIKIMVPGMSEDEGFVLRFKNEAQLIANLEHPYILPVYDFGEEKGVLYIVMRYLPSGSLADLIRRHPNGMPLERIGQIIAQVAQALDYAHSKGVVHRDMKPGNILLDSNGTAYLSDFGIAKVLTGTENLTGTGGVIGTPSHMSPEQGLGEAIDGRSDIYALGVILFEMLTGKQPFTAENPMALMLKHINDVPPSPRTLNPQVPHAVEAVVLRALAKRPSARYQTASDMGKAFEAALRGVSAGATGDHGTIDLGTQRVDDPSSTRALKAATVHVQASGPATDTAAAVAGARPGQTAVVSMERSVEGSTISHEAVAKLKQMEEVPLSFNGLSKWVNSQAWIAAWGEGLLLSAVTYLLLIRMTQGAELEAAILAVVPGLLLYSLLRAPTLGGLVAIIITLPPLLLHAPGLAALWLLLLIVSGARLHAKEIMLILLTIVAAGSPFGWLVPLLGPWWFKPRRVVLPAALGVGMASIFAAFLGWPDAGGLLPVPANTLFTDGVVISAFDTSYLGLLELSVWQDWAAQAVPAVTVTFENIAFILNATGGAGLLIAAGWALAATLSASNLRVDAPALRAGGIALGTLALLAVHLLNRPEAIGAVEPVSLVLAISCAAITLLLSQWPLQMDPNQNNQSGTVLRLLRQTLGAVFIAASLNVYAARIDSPVEMLLLWLISSVGTLVLITNPLVGAPIVFAGLAGSLALRNTVLAGFVAGLFIAYLVVNLIFDRRTPRRWNPLGAGLIVGSPGLSLLGIYPLGPLSIGALEAQVPAALLAGLGLVLLNVVGIENPQPLNVVAQLVVTLAGALLIERLMGLEFIGRLHDKLRRLIFTVAVAPIMSAVYYTVGGAPLGASVNLTLALILSGLAAAALVLAMGNRAIFWRAFVDRSDADQEESLLEDQEVIGATRAGRAPAKAAKAG